MLLYNWQHRFVYTSIPTHMCYHIMTATCHQVVGIFQLLYYFMGAPYKQSVADGTLLCSAWPYSLSSFLMIGVRMIHDCCFWDCNCRYVKLLTVVPQVTEALLPFLVLFLPATIWIVSLFMSSISLIFSSMLSNKLLIACILFYISDAVFFSCKVPFGVF